MDKVLTERQRNALRRALDGRLVVLCFGASVDSTGQLLNHDMRLAGYLPHAGKLLLCTDSSSIVFTYFKQTMGQGSWTTRQSIRRSVC